MITDRKNETFLTRLRGAQQDLDELKATQFVGSDATEILVSRRTTGWDADFELANNARAHLTANFLPDDLKAWQESTYNEICWGIYINNPGETTATLFHGEFCNVLPTYFIDTYSAQAEVQIVNTSGVTKHFYIRSYILTTALSGTRNTSYYIE